MSKNIKIVHSNFAQLSFISFDNSTIYSMVFFIQYSQLRGAHFFSLRAT